VPPGEHEEGIETLSLRSRSRPQLLLFLPPFLDTNRIHTEVASAVRRGSSTTLPLRMGSAQEGGQLFPRLDHKADKSFMCFQPSLMTLIDCPDASSAR